MQIAVVGRAIGSRIAKEKGIDIDIARARNATLVDIAEGNRGRAGVVRDLTVARSRIVPEDAIGQRRIG